MRQPVGPALQALRAATRDDHRRLDQAPMVRALLDVDNGVAGYRCFMQQVYRGYAAVEPALLQFESLSRAQVPRYRSRLAAVRNELRQLGNRPAAQGCDPVLVTPGSVAAYWGMRYVLDGSCHGARQLEPLLSRRPALAAVTDFEYWRLLLDGAPQWPAVVGRIETHARSAAAQAKMVAAARTTFAHFIGCFSEGSP